MQKNIEIIYENEDFLVINKPAGVVVHRASNDRGSKEDEAQGSAFLTDWLLENFPEIKDVGDDTKLRPGIVHRLDKDTSGIMIIPKNQQSFNYFKKLFQEKKIKKTYLALVYGKLVGKGIIKKPIGIKSGSIKRSVNSKNMKMIKEAITEYKVVKVLAKGKYTLLEVCPLTGKTHQIRVHLASIGHPVVGDNLYGNKKEKLGLDRQFLHAYSLEFLTPKGEKIKIEADLPHDLEEILQEISSLEKSELETIDYD